MIIDKIVSMFPPEVRESDAMRAVIALTQTLFEQLESTKKELQATREQLTKANEKIKVLEDEIAKLRKTPKRPKFRPNNMEPRDRTKSKNSSDTPPSVDGASFAKKETSEIIIKLQDCPSDARFKGYQTFAVQEIDIKAKETVYKLEVWQALSGEIFRAKIPDELKGSHFGPMLKALATSLYSQGMTQPGVHEFLKDMGIDLSSGQVNNILLNEAGKYSYVSEEILAAGLKEASFIRADDTGEKHQHKNGYCTHIGGQYFAYYTTSFSKSRENFLRILLQKKEGYYINDSMIWHLFQSGIEDDILNLFEDYKGRIYSSKKGINRLLNQLGIGSKKLRQYCIEGGLVGFISSTILKTGQVLLSDRAGQFALFNHAACWVHMERPLRKIICTSEQAEQELKHVRNCIWTLYDILKEAALTQVDKEKVHQLYNDLTAIKTISPEINAVIVNFATYRDEMLKSLDHPELPLHNNDSERDIRPVAKRRNISGSTKSNDGRKFRDGLMTIKQTCFRVGYNFWEFLVRWHRGDPPDLAEMVRNRYQASAA